MIDRTRFESFIRYEVGTTNTSKLSKNSINVLLESYDRFRDNEHRLQMPYDLSIPFDPKMVLTKDDPENPDNPAQVKHLELERRNHAYLRQYYLQMINTFGETGAIPELRQSVWKTFKVKAQRSLDDLGQNKGSKLAVAAYVGFSAMFVVGTLTALIGTALLASGVGAVPGFVLLHIGVVAAAASGGTIYALYKYRQDHLI